MKNSELHLLERRKMFNGHQERYRHFSQTCRTDMVFDVYLPPQVLKGYPAPVLYFLSGLNSDGSELVRQSGIQRFAAQWNIIVVFPDTSPRGLHVADGEEHYLGQGAGFYVNATEAPWAQHYQMESYISQELPDLIEHHFPVTQERSIAGFSMGGHGALHLALKHPGRYAAVSAFAPLCHPIDTEGGRQALSAYLGQNVETWKRYDSTELLQTASHKLPVLIDVGSEDALYPEVLQPEGLVRSAREKGFNIQYKVRPGYGHDYFFIASFIDSHIEFHAQALGL